MFLILEKSFLIKSILKKIMLMLLMELEHFKISEKKNEKETIFFFLIKN
jgi:hypothetical protein